jgi:hypothetical protein
MKQSFEQSIQSLQKQLLETPDLQEPISDRDAALAAFVLRFIVYRNKADIFLGCAAINLLNAYVKKPDGKLGWSFKNHLGPLLNAIRELASPNIKVSFNRSLMQGLLIINFRSFQFSFGGRQLSRLTMELTKEKVIPWDGIKKQPKAISILNFALESPCISNTTRGESSLLQRLADEMDDFDAGCFRFDRWHLVKFSNIEPGKDIEDPELKNHYRVKFEEAVGSLVLLRARFKAAHEKHITFVDVRPFIWNAFSIKICDHVNIFRPTLEKYFSVPFLEVDGRYYLIGYCERYSKDTLRIGIRLAEDLDHRPILRRMEFDKITNNTFERIFQFGFESHLSVRHRPVVYF